MIPQKIYEFGPYSLDSSQMLLRRAGSVVPLQPRALETLVVLLRQPGQVVAKQALMEQVWPDSFVEEGNLTQNIFLLRRELGRTPEGDEYIQTVPKRGYRMNVPVKEYSRKLEMETASAGSTGARNLFAGLGGMIINMRLQGIRSPFCQPGERRAYHESAHLASSPNCGLQFANRSHRVSAHRSMCRKVAG